MISGGYKKYNCLQPVYNVESKSITKKRGLKKVNKIKTDTISYLLFHKLLYSLSSILIKLLRKILNTNKKPQVMMKKKNKRSCHKKPKNKIMPWNKFCT